MRNKRAKTLRAVAAQMLIKEGVKLGEGYNKYNQAMNRIHWEPQLDEKGFPMMDPEGMPLMKPAQFPGTITCAFKHRVLYQKLKVALKGRSICRKGTNLG